MDSVACVFTKAGMELLSERFTSRSTVPWFTRDGVLHSFRVSVGLAFLSTFGPSATFHPGWGDTGTSPTRVAHAEGVGGVGDLGPTQLLSLVRSLLPRLKAPSKDNPTYPTYPGIVARELAAARLEEPAVVEDDAPVEP